MTLDADGKSRVFNVSAREPVAFVGLTITGGVATGDGGGVYVKYQTNTSFTNVAFSDNASEGDGGGVYIGSNGETSFTNVAFSDNASEGDGGGVYIGSNGKTNFRNVEFSHNLSYNGDGGGVYVGSSGETNFTNVEFRRNSSYDGDGGGVCVGSSCETSFTNVAFDLNLSDGGGGGVYVGSSGETSFANVEFRENGTYGDGGGVYISSSGETSFTNAEFRENVAVNGGGVYVGSSGKTSLANVAIVLNLATKNGGGVCIYGDATFVNATVAGNTAKNGGGANVMSSGSATLYNSIFALNDASSGGSDIYEVNSDSQLEGYNALSSFTAWDAGSNNYVYDASQSLFVDTANGDYALATDSQALDRGNNAYAVDALGLPLTTDLADKARISGIYVDLGPYEYQQTTTGLTSVTLSGTTQVGETLTASVSPSGATATYRWYRGTSTTSMTAISGATDSKYVLTSADVGYYIKVVATGSGAYAGSVSATTTAQVDRSVETPSLVVTTNGDVVDARDGLISLREAIQYAEADATLGGVVTFDASLKGATITLSGTELTIKEGITVDASALYDESTQTPGITIDADEKSRVFYVEGGTEENPVALIGLTITGGNTNRHGGGIYAYLSNTTLANCVVGGNTALNYGYGGGIYAYYSDTTLTNSVVSDNAAGEEGGGVYTYSGATTFTNCVVSGNTALNYGGGIYAWDNTLTLYNSIVALNTATSSGADVYDSDATIEAYNTLSSYTSWDAGSSNYAYDSSKPLFVDAANGDYRLAVGSQAINKGNNSYISGYATDLAGNTRVVGGTVDLGAYELFVKEAASTVVTTAADVVDAYDGWISLREAISYAKTGGVVTFDETLKGATITLAGAELKISKGLTIQGLVDETGAPQIAVDANGQSRVFHLAAGTADSPIKLIGLTITGGAVDGYGGGVRVSKTAFLENCVVVDCSANFGGGVSVDKTGVLTVDGGSVSENAAKYGAGLYVNGVATLRDADFAENVASVQGGGLYVDKAGAVETVNVALSHNTAPNAGGGLYLMGRATFNGGSISGNTAPVGAGASVYSGAIATFSGVEISENVASNYGGGVRVSGTATFEKSVVRGNEAAKFGGGVYVDKNKTVTVDGGVFSDNAAMYGAALFVNGTATLSNADFIANAASVQGGGLYVDSSGTANLTGVSLLNNAAPNAGGGLYLVGKATFNGGSISGNTAPVGAGASVSSGAIATFSGVEISENVASNYGGGV
ncbi:MAG: hypothetical protein IJE97_14110, partial [Thermoguttaceae bacterium]|nr:hypothetical protein [Thermoguttaceae bacterium]